jgi:hypothetical protein
VKRRILDVCVLAYPRGRRDRDREYLRDLALELAGADGLRRQALSLLRGGLGERIELWRRGRSEAASAWMRRIVIIGAAFAATAFTASSLIGTAAGEGERVEQERLTCVGAAHPVSKRNGGPNGRSGCAGAKAMAVARSREGWDCATRRQARGAQQVIAVRCSLGQEAGAWRVF